MRTKLLTPIIFFLSFLFLFQFNFEKAEAGEASGWVTLGSELLGDDLSCGADAGVYDFQTTGYQDSNPVDVPSLTVQLIEKSSGSVLDTLSVNDRSMTDTICIDTVNNNVSISVDGGSSYYDFSGGYGWVIDEDGPVSHGKRVRVNIHLKPTTYPEQDIAHISPIGGAVLPQEPSYEMALNNVPDLYGALGTYNIILLVQDPSDNLHSYTIPVSGGAGVYTADPRGFTEEGLYRWGFGFKLNGSTELIKKAPLSAFSGWESFRIKTSCNLPWGGTINDGEDVIAYQNSLVGCTESCQSETRICSEGVLSGSYTSPTCSVQSCAVSLDFKGSSLVDPTIEGSSIEIESGEGALLEWSTSNAEYCEATNDQSDLGWIGSQALGGNDIYVLRGRNSFEFYKYSISSDHWTRLNDAPDYIGNGASILYPGGGDFLYLSDYLVGTGGAFYRYSISMDSWETLSYPGVNFNYGSSLSYPGTGDYIYALAGANSTNFLRYSISLNTWESLSSTPGAVYMGGDLISDNSDNLYAFQGNNANGFYRYSISSDSWQAMSPVPGTVTYGGSLSHTGGDYIYAVRGNNEGLNDPMNYDFYRYSISNNNWSSLSSVPDTIGKGGSLFYPGSGEKVYALRGTYSTDLFTYSISSNSWTSKSYNIPLISLEGDAVSSGSGDYIYMSTGYYNPDTSDDLYRYSMGSGNIDFIKSFPEKLNYSGGALGYSNTDNDVYIFTGYTDFYRYRSSVDTWEQMAPTPSNTYVGAALAFVDSEDSFYALKGYMDGDFWKYSVASNSWTTMQAIPATVSWGGDLIYAGGDYLYAISGNNGSGFYRYSISSNSWSNMASLPVSVYRGGSLVYPGSGDYIYASPGDYVDDFYRYSISSNSWEAVTPFPVTVGYGAALNYPGSGDYIYFTYKDVIYRYSIVTDAWEKINANVPLHMSYGSDTAPGGGIAQKEVYPIVTTTYDLQCRNSLSEWTPVGSVTVVVNDCIPDYTYACLEPFEPDCSESPCQDTTGLCIKTDSSCGGSSSATVTECESNGQVCQTKLCSEFCTASPLNFGNWREVAP